MKTVSIVGVGRVGGAICYSLPREKYSVTNLIVRRRESGEKVAGKFSSRPTVTQIDELDGLESDIVFITTPDPEIKWAAAKLAEKVIGRTIFFHTSGSYASSILEGPAARGFPVGSIHPLVSISLPELGPQRFRKAFFCVEGTDEAVETGTAIVNDFGGRPFSVDTKYKTLYHAAAVTACGHLVALFDAAVEMMTKAGLSAETAKTILLPLVTSTVKNLGEQSTAAALTGTFARADIDTLTRHLTTLNENVSDDLLEIYLLLGERSLELASKQGVSSERIDTMRTKVSIAKSKLKW